MGCLLHQSPKFYNKVFLLVGFGDFHCICIGWFIQTFQLPIAIYNILYHWECTSIYCPLSYPLRSLKAMAHNLAKKMRGIQNALRYFLSDQKFSAISKDKKNAVMSQYKNRLIGLNFWCDNNEQSHSRSCTMPIVCLSVNPLFSAAIGALLVIGLII